MNWKESNVSLFCGSGASLSLNCLCQNSNLPEIIHQWNLEVHKHAILYCMLGKSTCHSSSWLHLHSRYPTTTYIPRSSITDILFLPLLSDIPIHAWAETTAALALTDAISKYIWGAFHGAGNMLGSRLAGEKHTRSPPDNRPPMWQASEWQEEQGQCISRWSNWTQREWPTRFSIWQQTSGCFSFFTHARRQPYFFNSHPLCWLIFESMFSKLL
jgi:hypothetical protein